MNKKFIAFLTILLALIFAFAGCGETPPPTTGGDGGGSGSSGGGGGAGFTPDNNTYEFQRGLDAKEFTMASISGTDQYGRSATVMKDKKDAKRYVGVFYWLWLGTNDSQYGVHDNTKILLSENGYNKLIALGSRGLPEDSPTEYMHWINEPMFGYYNSLDPWVIKRHIEMLTYAGVDYIFFDTTNTNIFESNLNENLNNAVYQDLVNVGPAYNFLDTLLEFQQQGFDVPKVMFYTNSKSNTQVDKIYNRFYSSTNGKYDSLWFRGADNKPVIVGVTPNNNGASDMYNPENREAGSDGLVLFEQIDMNSTYAKAFDIKESQWPTGYPVGTVNENGFPWMSWCYPQHYHTGSKAVSVSVSQHSWTDTSFSFAHRWSSKGYNAKKDTNPKAEGYNIAQLNSSDHSSVEQEWWKGQNFENQWETVFNLELDGKEVEFVNVTGWNEWVVEKKNYNGTMIMVDNYSAEYSRDVEPDKRYYRDGVYMQLVRNIRNYKFNKIEDGKTYGWQNYSVTAPGAVLSMKAVYKDFAGDAVNRDFYGFDIRYDKNSNVTGAWYSDNSARNDIIETRVCHDNDYMYFAVKTKSDITTYQAGDENWMNILIKTGAGGNSFEGYNYIINRNVSGSTATIEKSLGGWNWQECGIADLNIYGNIMIVKVPLSSLGLTKENARIEFKVSDNVVRPSWYEEEYGEHNMMYHYITGDSAPIGRLNYTYGY